MRLCNRGFLLSVGIAWILYLVFGHYMIEAVYLGNLGHMADRIMPGRSSTPVTNYFQRADELLVFATLRLLAVYAVIVALVIKPIGACFAALSFLFSSFVLFCLLESFPQLITNLNLGGFGGYYGYKANYIYDPELVYEAKPFQNVISSSRGSHYSPLYGIEIEPMTIKWVTDQNGFRNNGGLRSADVVIVGDSYVEFGDERETTFEARLDRNLEGVSFVNLGKSGYGPFQYLEVFKRYGLGYKPKYALFAFYEGNDIGDIASYLRWKRNKVASEDSLVYRLSEKAFLQRYLFALRSVVSEIQKRVRSSIRVSLYYIAKSRGYAHKIHPDLALLRLGDREYKILFVDRLSTDSPQAMLKTEEWRSLRNVLAEFRQLCKENNIFPAIIYIPMAAHIYAEYSTDGSGQGWLQLRESQITAKRNAEIALTSLAAELEIELINLVRPFEDAARDGHLLYHQLDSHWNSTGSEIAAKFVAEALRSRIGVSERSKNDRTRRNVLSSLSSR